MEGTFANELYKDSLQISGTDLGSISAANDFDEGDLLTGDGSLWDGSDEELDRASDLDREWRRRRDQFHTVGYRDGIIAGKEVAAQEGFNIGFKESALIGYNWGLVRGVTSALAFLPDKVKKKLIETEKQNRFQKLHESVCSHSTEQAFKLFHDGSLTNQTAKPSEYADASPNVTALPEKNSDCSRLENYIEEVQSLLLEAPAIKVEFAVDK